MFAEVLEGVNHAFEALTRVGDGEVPLDEGPKLGIKVEGACLQVPRNCVYTASHTERAVEREHGTMADNSGEMAP